MSEQHLTLWISLVLAFKTGLFPHPFEDGHTTLNKLEVGLEIGDGVGCTEAVEIWLKLN